MFSLRQSRRRVAGTVLLFLLLAAIARSESAPSLSRESVTNAIRAGIARLTEVYWSPILGIWLDRPGDDLRGVYERRRNPPWWPSANAVEMLIDFMAATGSSEYDATIATLYELQKDHAKRRGRLVAELKKRGQWNDADEATWQGALQKSAAEPPPPGGYYSDFQNEYLDDSGWWAITWLKMYDRTHAAKYLVTAKTIHAHMAKNWKPERGGGIVWSEDADKQRPNAIANELFLILSARLYERTHEAAFLESAEKTLQWFHDNGLFDGTAVVDAPQHRGDYWSYNQGAFIGALTALYRATEKAEYLDEAVKVTDGVLHRSGLVRPDGVLFEKIGTGGDATLFKGICVRYLAQFRGLLRERSLHPEVSRAIDDCIRSSAEALLQHGLGDDGLFVAEWHENAGNRRTNFNTQVSALAALIGFLPQTDAALGAAPRRGVSVGQ